MKEYHEMKTCARLDCRVRVREGRGWGWSQDWIFAREGHLSGYGAQLLGEQIVGHLYAFCATRDDDFSIARAFEEVVAVTDFDAAPARDLNLGNGAAAATEHGADERVGDGDEDGSLVIPPTALTGAITPWRGAIEFAASPSASTTLQRKRRLHAVRTLSMHEGGVRGIFAQRRRHESYRS